MSSIPVDLFNLSRLIACATSEMCIGSRKHRGASVSESFSARVSHVLSTLPITHQLICFLDKRFLLLIRVTES